MQWQRSGACQRSVEPWQRSGSTAAPWQRSDSAVTAQRCSSSAPWRRGSVDVGLWHDGRRGTPRVRPVRWPVLPCEPRLLAVAMPPPPAPTIKSRMSHPAIDDTKTSPILLKSIGKLQVGTGCQISQIRFLRVGQPPVPTSSSPRSAARPPPTFVAAAPVPHDPAQPSWPNQS